MLIRCVTKLNSNSTRPTKKLVTSRSRLVICDQLGNVSHGTPAEVVVEVQRIRFSQHGSDRIKQRPVGPIRRLAWIQTRDGASTFFAIPELRKQSFREVALRRRHPIDESFAPCPWNCYDRYDTQDRYFYEIALGR